jgi:hypothetical protein
MKAATWNEFSAQPALHDNPPAPRPAPERCSGPSTPPQSIPALKDGVGAASTLEAAAKGSVPK